jgi:Ca-activated chloride channel family protein
MKRLKPVTLICSVLPFTALFAFQGVSVFRAGTELVQVYATVLDRHNHYVDGLTRESFQVLENGQPQPLSSFEDPSDGVSCALILDTTGSMEKTLPFVRNSVTRFIDQLGPKDSIAVYTFAERLERKQDFTADRAAAKRAVLRTRAGGQTALFDALAETAHEIADRPGKKAMVVFTDGADNSSALTANAAAARLKKMGIPLFAIAEGEAIESQGLVKVLRLISHETGGMVYVAKKMSDVDKVFETISLDVQHTYLMTYKPPSSADKLWRAITVNVLASSELHVRARQGYYPE